MAGCPTEVNLVSKLQLLQQSNHPKYGDDIGRSAVQTVLNGTRLDLFETERHLRGEQNLTAGISTPPLRVDQRGSPPAANETFLL